MIGHFFYVMLRATLRAGGIKVGEQRLGRCPYCHCNIWESDKPVRLHGFHYHRDCATYSRRAPA